MPQLLAQLSNVLEKALNLSVVLLLEIDQLKSKHNNPAIGIKGRNLKNISKYVLNRLNILTLELFQ